MKRFIALLVSLLLVFSVAAADNMNSYIYADTIIQFMEAADLDADDLQRIIDVANLLLEVKLGASESVSQAVGIEGDWILTDVRGINATEDEVAQVKEMIDSGNFVITYSFRGNTVTGTMRSPDSEDTQSGTYVIEGNTIIVTREGQTDSGEPMEFNLYGDTLEMMFGQGIMIFTRQ